MISYKMLNTLKVGDYIRVIIHPKESTIPTRQGEGKIVQLDRNETRTLLILDTGLIRGMEKENPFYLGDREYTITTIYRKEWVKLW